MTGMGHDAFDIEWQPEQREKMNRRLQSLDTFIERVESQIDCKNVWSNDTIAVNDVLGKPHSFTAYDWAVEKGSIYRGRQEALMELLGLHLCPVCENARILISKDLCPECLVRVTNDAVKRAKEERDIRATPPACGASPPTKISKAEEIRQEQLGRAAGECIMRQVSKRG